MADPMCALWQALLQDTGNRGKIYSDFLRDRKTLTNHFYLCKVCEDLILEIDPEIEMYPDNSMTDAKFSEIIREFWRLSRQKNQTP